MNSNNYNCLVKLAASPSVLREIGNGIFNPQTYMPGFVTGALAGVTGPAISLRDMTSKIQPSSYNPLMLRRGATTGAAGAMMQASLASQAPHIDNTIAPGRHNYQRMTDMMAGATTGAAGTAMGSIRPEPRRKQPVVNPATGGTRLTYKGNHPIVPGDVIVPQTLPVTPSSSGRIAPITMREADRLASWNARSRELNNRRKQEVANNLDAMFANLTRENQARRSQGLPDRQLSVADVYSPNFRSPELDGGDFENRLYNDIAMSTITLEAARRGTPYNDSEILMLQHASPSSWVDREERRKSPVNTISPENTIWDRQFQGLPLLTPEMRGNIANGFYER